LRKRYVYSHNFHFFHSCVLCDACPKEQFYVIKTIHLCKEQFYFIKTIDLCKELNCHDNAKCVIGSNVTCECNPGFQGSGQHCEGM
jgi:hypothetical protein